MTAAGEQIELEPLLEDTLQTWVDEFAQKAGLVQWIPVLVMQTDGVAAAEVCYEHADARGTDLPIPVECDDCTIVVDPIIRLFPISVQRAVLAHEVAHYCLGYTGTWNLLDENQFMWRSVRQWSTYTLLLCGITKAAKTGVAPKAVGLLMAVSATLTSLGLWCTWRHAKEEQESEFLADEMAVRLFGAEPDEQWQEMLRDGEMLRQRIPLISAMLSHPSATKRIKRVQNLIS